MPGPERKPSEMFLAYQESLRNSIKREPEKTYRNSSYRDTIKLLEEKILNFIRLNDKLKSHINNRRRFVRVTVSSIEFNLTEFSDGYKTKFIANSFEDYSRKFISLLLPLLIDFTREIGCGGFSYSFRFKFYDQLYQKTKMVIA